MAKGNPIRKKIRKKAKTILRKRPKSGKEIEMEAPPSVIYATMILATIFFLLTMSTIFSRSMEDFRMTDRQDDFGHDSDQTLESDLDLNKGKEMNTLRIRNERTKLHSLLQTSNTKSNRKSNAKHDKINISFAMPKNLNQNESVFHKIFSLKHGSRERSDGERKKNTSESISYETIRDARALGSPRNNATSGKRGTNLVQKTGMATAPKTNLFLRYDGGTRGKRNVETNIAGRRDTGMSNRNDTENESNDHTLDIMKSNDYAFDCDQGKIESGKKLFACFENMVWMSCEQPLWLCNHNRLKCEEVVYTGSYVEYLYSTMMTHGVAFDYLAARQQIGRVWFFIDNKPYVLSCPKIKIKMLNSSSCYNDDIKVATDGTKIVYVTRSKFITQKINKKPCDDDDLLERGKKMATYRQTILLSSELMALWIWHDISSSYILSKIFGLKSISTILLNEESYLSGYDRRSIITLMHLAWRRLSPYFLFTYGSIKIIWSLIIFAVGLKKKLSFCHSLSFVFNPIKHYNELQKIILEKKLTKDNEVSRSYRMRLNKIGELGISEVSHFHLSALYENAISINKKMNETTRRLDVAEHDIEQSMRKESRGAAKNEATTLEEDSLTTVSSDGSIELDTKTNTVAVTIRKT